MAAVRGAAAGVEEGEWTDVAEWARVKLGFEADERQAELLRCGSRNVVLNCCRQWGKSSVAAVRAVHTAWTRAGSLVLVASPTERQSGEFLGKAREFGRRLSFETRTPLDGRTGRWGLGKKTLVFPNGSRIVALPGTEATVRGYSAAAMVIVDEAARVGDELYKCLRPVLAVSAGDLWLLSTPFGQRGFFWETWEMGGEGWARFRATGEECPRIGAEWLEEERLAMGEEWVRQEYGCEFVANGEEMFDPRVLAGAVE